MITRETVWAAASAEKLIDPEIVERRLGHTLLSNRWVDMIHWHLYCGKVGERRFVEIPAFSDRAREGDESRYESALLEGAIKRLIGKAVSAP